VLRFAGTVAASLRGNPRLVGKAELAMAGLFRR